LSSSLHLAVIIFIQVSNAFPKSVPLEFRNAFEKETYKRAMFRKSKIQMLFLYHSFWEIPERSRALLTPTLLNKYFQNKIY